MSVPFSGSPVEGAGCASNIENIADRSAAYGVPAMIVDGQDVVVRLGKPDPRRARSVLEPASCIELLAHPAEVIAELSRTSREVGLERLRQVQEERRLLPPEPDRMQKFAEGIQDKLRARRAAPWAYEDSGLCIARFLEKRDSWVRCKGFPSSSDCTKLSHLGQLFHKTDLLLPR